MSEPAKSATVLSVVEKTTPAEVKAKVVDLLEDLLARAKKGEIIGIAVAGVDNERSGFTCWSHTEHFTHLAGAIAILDKRYWRRGDS